MCKNCTLDRLLKTVKQLEKPQRQVDEAKIKDLRRMEYLRGRRMPSNAELYEKLEKSLNPKWSAPGKALWTNKHCPN